MAGSVRAIQPVLKTWMHEVFFSFFFFFFFVHWWLG
jgi:hypothetical protein